MNVYSKSFETLNWELPRSPKNYGHLFSSEHKYHNYIMIIQGRCGSTWLNNTIEKQTDLGNPKEWFNPAALVSRVKNFGAQDFDDFMARLAVKHNPFSVQIDPERFFYLAEIINIKTSFQKASFKWIDLRRSNLLAQSFSAKRAQATGKWHNESSVNVKVPDRAIWNGIANAIKNEQSIDKWYRNKSVTPLRLYYEDIVTDMIFVLNRISGVICKQSYTPIQLEKNSNSAAKPPKTDSEMLSFYERHHAFYEYVLMNRQTIKPKEISLAINKICN